MEKHEQWVQALLASLGIDLPHPDCEKKECECKGTLQHSTGDVQISANICPDCEKDCSSVTASFSVGLLFKSTEITKPRCQKLRSQATDAIVGTSLNVGGVGQAVTELGTFDAAFALSLFESVGQNTPDRYIITIQFFGPDGSLFLFIANETVPDNELTVKKCHDKCDDESDNHTRSYATQQPFAEGQFLITTKNGYPEIINLTEKN